eukprot:tig00020553_g10617.t1
MPRPADPASGERAEKRARAEPAAAQVVHALQLPDALMSDVFNLLGLRESWPLRAVCRRWRKVIQDMQWGSFELRVDQSGAAVQDSLSAIFERRKLRLSPGASVSLRSELEPIVCTTDDAEDDAEDDARETVSAAAAAAARQSHRRAAEATCGLLAAITRSHAGPAQPRRVIIELVKGYFPMSEDFVCVYLLGVLRALRPPEGAASGSGSGLESLSVGLVSKEPVRWPLPGWAPMPWPQPEELGAALAPLGALRSLDLYFDHLDVGVGPGHAAVIAASCPLLRTVALGPSGGASDRATLAELAPLARLESLALVDLGRTEADSMSDGLDALSYGAASRTLRTITVTSRCAYQAGAFPSRSADAFFASVRFSEGLALALRRMRRLESFAALEVRCDSTPLASIPALGDIASLRELSLDFGGFRHDPDHGALALRAVAEALSRLPRLERLWAHLWPFDIGPEDVAAFLGSAGVKRTLAGLDLVLNGPLEEAEAEAILALPALQRVSLGFYLGDYTLSIRPFEILLEGLRPQVAASVNLKCFEFPDDDDVAIDEAANTIAKMFAARQPAPAAAATHPHA